VKPTRDTYLVNSKDVDEKLSQAARVIRATYVYPYQMHGSFGTSCAVADVQNGRATIYSASQAVYPLRSTVATLLGMPAESVHVIFKMASGCYGVNGADTVSYDAALLSQAAGMPVVISFTVETDGRLPAGETLKDAIEAVDAATANGPAYYMINCAHPDHFDAALAAGESWLKRIRGLRANASRLSHAELDEAVELDDGNPVELGRQYRDLRRKLGQIVVMGGCCGTDHRHIEAICHACTEAEAA